MSVVGNVGKGTIALLLIGASIGIAPWASAQTTSGKAQILKQEQQLAAYAKSHGATLSPIGLAVHETLGANAIASDPHPATRAGMPVVSHDCTATATITRMQHVPVKLAATAPSCSAAIGMIASGVKTFLKRSSAKS